jgi:hypothetical protein
MRVGDMRVGDISLAVILMLASSAFAATPKPMSVDKSGTFLIDPATSAQVWKDNMPARVMKLYPSKKFRFVSEVTGGFNESKTCVVSARAMLLPTVFLPMQGTQVVYSPIKSSTAFDAVPGLDSEKCQELARGKLKEAIQSLTSALAAS